MHCISKCQRKSLRSVMLQVGGIRYSPCASASLTLRVGEATARRSPVCLLVKITRLLDHDPDGGIAVFRNSTTRMRQVAESKYVSRTKGRVSSVSARSWLAHESIRPSRYPREIEFSRGISAKTGGCFGPGLSASKLVMTGKVGGGVIGWGRLAKWGLVGVRGSAGASPSRGLPLGRRPLALGVLPRDTQQDANGQQRRPQRAAAVAD